MIIDSSALIAILRDEPEAMICARAIAAVSHRRISAANFVESAIVIDESRDPVPAAALTTSSKKPSLSSSELPRPKHGSHAKPTGISVEAAAISRG
jgi:uncharacterized protein with PIN domain